MITKIESINNIGNYEAYAASGDVMLKKMNIVYAENGAGKTTLSRILHSLSSNDKGGASQTIINHSSSIIHHQSFIINHSSSIIHHQSFIINH